MSLINLISLGIISAETGSGDPGSIGKISMDLNKEFSNLLNQLRDAKGLNGTDGESSRPNETETNMLEPDALIELAAFVENAERQLQKSRQDNKEVGSWQNDRVITQLSLSDLQKFIASEIERIKLSKNGQGSDGVNQSLETLFEEDFVEFKSQLDIFVGAVNGFDADNGEMDLSKVSVEALIISDVAEPEISESASIATSDNKVIETPSYDLKKENVVRMEMPKVERVTDQDFNVESPKHELPKTLINETVAKTNVRTPREENTKVKEKSETVFETKTHATKEEIVHQPDAEVKLGRNSLKLVHDTQEKYANYQSPQLNVEEEEPKATFKNFDNLYLSDFELRHRRFTHILQGLRQLAIKAASLSENQSIDTANLELNSPNALDVFEELVDLGRNVLKLENGSQFDVVLPSNEINFGIQKEIDRSQVSDANKNFEQELIGQKRTIIRTANLVLPPRIEPFHNFIILPSALQDRSAQSEKIDNIFYNSASTNFGWVTVEENGSLLNEEKRDTLGKTELVSNSMISAGETRSAATEREKYFIERLLLAKGTGETETNQMPESGKGKITNNIDVEKKNPDAKKTSPSDFEAMAKDAVNKVSNAGASNKIEKVTENHSVSNTEPARPVYEVKEQTNQTNLVDQRITGNVNDIISNVGPELGIADLESKKNYYKPNNTNVVEQDIIFERMSRERHLPKVTENSQDFSQGKSAKQELREKLAPSFVISSDPALQIDENGKVARSGNNLDGKINSDNGAPIKSENKIVREVVNGMGNLPKIPTSDHVPENQGQETVQTNTVKPSINAKEASYDANFNRPLLFQSFEATFRFAGNTANKFPKVSDATVRFDPVSRVVSSVIANADIIRMSKKTTSLEHISTAASLNFDTNLLPQSSSQTQVSNVSSNMEFVEKWVDSRLELTSRDWVQNMVKTMVSALKKGNQRLVFTLNPASLGRINVTFSNKQNGLDVKIHAQRKATIALLGSSEAKLLSSLENAGHKVNNLSYADMENSKTNPDTSGRRESKQGDYSGNENLESQGNALNNDSLSSMNDNAQIDRWDNSIVNITV